MTRRKRIERLEQGEREMRVDMRALGEKEEKAR